MKKETLKTIKRVSRTVRIPKAKIKQSAKLYKRSHGKQVFRD